MKAKLASLFLFALATGARANSCARVTSGDFFGFMEMDGSVFTLSVNINKVKGHHGQKLTLLFAGNPRVKRDIDILYWLNIV